ncbi:MAG: LPS export ABC transporter periplasmic protein LptC [Rudaea sp.]|nr:LPS export ABC transporter periplasmic protein LptC [Rudaea sp.]
MERKTLATIIALAMLALGAQIMVWVFLPHDQAPQFVGPPRSDYTLATFTLDALDDAGKLSFSVTGPRLAHKEDDGSVYLTTPDYVMVDNSGNLWKGKSDSAWVNKDGTIMKLEGKVDMHRIPTATVDPLQLLTTDLTVTTTPKDKTTPKDAGPKDKPATEPKPKQTTMETAALATIIDPNHIAHGVGMKANLEGLKDLEFFSDVHWIAQPKSHANTTQ